VELPSCTGIWTVYYKSSRGIITEDNEYHAYLIISLESRTMVLQTGDDLGEVTETVDYNVQASTIAAGNLFGRYGPLLIKSFSCHFIYCCCTSACICGVIGASDWLGSFILIYCLWPLFRPVAHGSWWLIAMALLYCTKLVSYHYTVLVIQLMIITNYLYWSLEI